MWVTDSARLWDEMAHGSAVSWLGSGVLKAADLSSSGVEPVLTGGSCQGIEHALPDFVRCGVDARRRQGVLQVRTEEGVNFGQGVLDFSDLDVEVLHEGVAT